MTSTTAPVRPEFAVVRRLHALAARDHRRSAPRATFSEDLRARLLAEARSGRLPAQRAASSDWGN